MSGSSARTPSGLTPSGLTVKVCGVTREDDAHRIAAAGVDWIGLNFWPGSKRVVDTARGRALAAAARAGNPAVVVVGVFVDEDPDRIAAIAGEVGLDRLQLHGDEGPAACAALGPRAFKAVAIAAAADLVRAAAYPGALVLLDTPSAGRGGAGVAFDWSIARDAATIAGKQILLAGGLHPDNVAAAVRAVRPWGVDVASGVESAPGVKDLERAHAVGAAARAAAAALEPEPLKPEKDEAP
jgi:phosphoribosylanthranilate isomerase